MESTNSGLKENESTDKELQSNVKSDNVWALGIYQSISTMLPPISAHLIRLIGVDKDEIVLDISCGDGNTAISARREGADVTGIDITPNFCLLQYRRKKLQM